MLNKCYIELQYVWYTQYDYYVQFEQKVKYILYYIYNGTKGEVYTILYIQWNKTHNITTTNTNTSNR